MVLTRLIFAPNHPCIHSYPDHGGPVEEGTLHYTDVAAAIFTSFCQRNFLLYQRNRVIIAGLLYHFQVSRWSISQGQMWLETLCLYTHILSEVTYER